MVNQVNPRKLHLSKWTAQVPQNREKHFLVTELIRDEDEVITGCILEAVINQNSYTLTDWRELKDRERWRQGWK